MNFVPYRRVSTRKQGDSGLGLEAQDRIIDAYLQSRPGAEVIGRFVEVESGKVRSRPELTKALALCREAGATLIVAKLDRLARDSAFVLGLRDAGVEFLCCDFPQANRLVIGIIACIAEYEASLVSERTRNALASAKARGTRLGNPRPVSSLQKTREARAVNYRVWAESTLPVVRDIRDNGRVLSHHGIARCLNARGFRTVLSKSFTHKTVRDLLEYGGAR